MRFEISRGGSGLTYEIRNSVIIANKLKELGVNIIRENIGAPVQKGEKIPDWMKEVLIGIIKDDASFAYSPTKGVDSTKEFLADRLNLRMTLLDKDEAEFEYVVKTIAEKITEYINSAKTSLQTSINLS